MDVDKSLWTDLENIVKYKTGKFGVCRSCCEKMHTFSHNSMEEHWVISISNKRLNIKKFKCFQIRVYMSRANYPKNLKIDRKLSQIPGLKLFSVYGNHGNHSISEKAYLKCAGALEWSISLKCSFETT